MVSCSLPRLEVHAAMAEISEEAQEQQYTSFSSSSSSPIAAPEVDPDEESLASVLAKKSPMPFLEAANAEKWVKDPAQRTESDAPPNDLSHQTRRRPRPSRVSSLLVFDSLISVALNLVS